MDETVISQSTFEWNSITEKINCNLDVGRTQFVTSQKIFFARE